MSLNPMASHPYRRYVAIGDSSTEGLDDPDGRGRFRGWADRLAAHLGRDQPELLYANLGIRGRTTRQILGEQLGPALAMAPDLMTLFSGTNDVVASRFDLGAVIGDIDAMQKAIVGSGATLLTFTLPDLTPVMPMARRLAPRIAALNAAIRELSVENGVRLVDFALYPVAVDPRLWASDRLHANSEGHRRIAAALAHALCLPDSDPSWAAELPPITVRSLAGRAQDELTWIARFLAPWLWRHLWGRSSGDGVTAKRPILRPLTLQDS